MVVWSPDWRDGSVCKHCKGVICGECSEKYIDRDAVKMFSPVPPLCPTCNECVRGIDHLNGLASISKAAGRRGRHHSSRVAGTTSLSRSRSDKRPESQPPSVARESHDWARPYLVGRPLGAHARRAYAMRRCGLKPLVASRPGQQVVPATPRSPAGLRKATRGERRRPRFRRRPLSGPRVCRACGPRAGHGRNSRPGRLLRWSRGSRTATRPRRPSRDRDRGPHRGT